MGLILFAMVGSRINKANTRTDFTIVPNAALESGKLSVAAMGLLVYLLHLPDNFPLRKTRLYEKFPNGRDKIITTFNELVQAGYVIQHQERNEHGSFNYWYEIFSAVTDKPLTVGLQKEKRSLYSKETFSIEIIPYEKFYGPQMIREFIKFWSEIGTHGKMRVNETKGWSTPSRLEKFAKTSKAFNRYQKQGTPATTTKELEPIVKKVWRKNS